MSGKERAEVKEELLQRNTLYALSFHRDMVIGCIWIRPIAVFFHRDDLSPNKGIFLIVL